MSLHTPRPASFNFLPLLCLFVTCCAERGRFRIKRFPFLAPIFRELLCFRPFFYIPFVVPFAQVHIWMSFCSLHSSLMRHESESNCSAPHSSLSPEMTSRCLSKTAPSFPIGRARFLYRNATYNHDRVS